MKQICHEKEGQAMKRNYVYTLAALLFTGVAFTACSSEDEVVNVAAEKVQTTYSVNIPATKGIDADTRALSLDGKTLNSTWTKGDKVYVYKKGTNYIDDNTLEADASGPTANLTGTLASEYAVDDELLLVYGYKKAWSGAPTVIQAFDYTSGQKGTFNDLQDFDYATAIVEVTAVKDGQITTTPASFKPSQSIFKLTFKDDSSSPKVVNVRFLTISGEKIIIRNAPFATTDADKKGYPVTLALENPSPEVWVALRMDESIANDVITFEVEDPDGKIYKGTKAVTADVVNGKYYTTTITLTQTGEMNKLYITPEDSYTLSGRYYYIEKNANISGSAKDYAVRVIKDGVNVTLDNINIIEFDTNRQSNVVVTLEGDNTIGTLFVFGAKGDVTFKGTGSLTFKWTESTPLENYTNVTIDSALQLVKNDDGTYTIKKK